MNVHHELTANGASNSTTSSSLLGIEHHPSITSTTITASAVAVGATAVTSSCRVCGSPTELRRCSSCKSAFYCSQTHQQADWPNHRTECRQLTRDQRLKMELLLQQQQQQLIMQQQQLHSNAHTDAITMPTTIMPFANSHSHHDGSGAGEMTPFELAAVQMQRDLQRQQQQSHQQLQQPRHPPSHREPQLEGNTMRLNEMNLLHPVQGDSNLRDDDLCKIIIHDLNVYGVAVIDDFLGRTAGLEILREVDHMYGAGVFQNGQLVSNTAGSQIQQTIRGDKTTWVKGTEPACTNIGFLINQIDNLVITANRMRDNGTLGQYNIRERTKAMVACYPGSGSHYVMHVDNPNQDGRVITAIYYLNLDWDSALYGGRLTIHPKPGNTQATIDPAFDRILFFWSDRRNPHEVQPAHRTRYAITVWYFDADEREAALNRNRSQQLQQQQQQQQQLQQHAPIQEQQLMQTSNQVPPLGVQSQQQQSPQPQQQQQQPQQPYPLAASGM